MPIKELRAILVNRRVLTVQVIILASAALLDIFISMIIVLQVVQVMSGIIQTIIHVILTVLITSTHKK